MDRWSFGWTVPPIGISANAGGQIGSVIAAAVMLSVLQGMGIVGG